MQELIKPSKPVQTRSVVCHFSSQCWQSVLHPTKNSSIERARASNLTSSWISYTASACAATFGRPLFNNWMTWKRQSWSSAVGQTSLRTITNYSRSIKYKKWHNTGCDWRICITNHDLRTVRAERIGMLDGLEESLVSEFAFWSADPNCRRMKHLARVRKASDLQTRVMKANTK